MLAKDGACGGKEGEKAFKEKAEQTEKVQRDRLHPHLSATFIDFQ